MKLNLPIFDLLENCENILIAGAGGGFDIFVGLPLYFTLRKHGKKVHLANYTFSDFRLAQIAGKTEVLIEEFLLGARGQVKLPFSYYPEGYLAQWFAEVRGEDVPIWLFAKKGVRPLVMAYNKLLQTYNIDAIILVDGGVDSLMRGDEEGAGTLLEDSISLAAVAELDVPVKILACIGFGTEVEEAVCHAHALENMAALIKEQAFFGSCALTPQMKAFSFYAEACQYVWEQPKHHKSHISTRIIPAAQGEFANYHLYPDDRTTVFLSPLMSLYWFFDATAVARRSLIIEALQDTYIFEEAFRYVMELRRGLKLRRRRPLPY